MDWAATRQDFRAFISKAKFTKNHKDERTCSLDYLYSSAPQYKQNKKTVSSEVGCHNCLHLRAESKWEDTVWPKSVRLFMY